MPGLESLTQRLLRALKRWREGEANAGEELNRTFGDLVEIHLKRLRNTARLRARFAGSPNYHSDGDAILQIAVMRALGKLRQPGFILSGGDDWFRRWIATIIIFVAREQRRKGWLALREESAAELVIAARANPLSHHREPDERLVRGESETLAYLERCAVSKAQNIYLDILRELSFGEATDALSAATALELERPKSMAASAVRWAKKMMKRKAGDMALALETPSENPPAENPPAENPPAENPSPAPTQGIGPPEQQPDSPD